MRKFLLFLNLYFLTFFIIFACPLGTGVVFSDGENLIANPSFEEVSGDKPIAWRIWTWEKDSTYSSLGIETDETFSGSSSAIITNNKDNDARYIQSINVQQDSYYRVSCMIKTEGVETNGLGANISIEGRLETSKDIKGTSKEWERVELYVKTEKNVNFINITLGLGGYGKVNKGKAYFDDVSFVKVDFVPAGAPLAIIGEVEADKDKESSKSDLLSDRGRRSTKYDWLLLIGAFVAAIFGALFAYKTRKNNGFDSTKVYEGDYFPGDTDQNEDQNNDQNNDQLGTKNQKGSTKPTDQRDSSQLFKSWFNSDPKTLNTEVNSINDNKEIKFFKPDKQDYIIMASMTLIYLVLALVNLGSLNVPKTGWMPVTAGEGFTVDFGRQVNISRICYYQGHGQGWHIDGSYRVEYMDQDGEFKPLGSFEKDDFYKWGYSNVHATTDRIRLIVDEPGGTLLEVGFFEDGSDKPLTDFLIVEKNIDMNDEGSVENLFDENVKIEYNPSFMTSTYFDEIYHARTAYEHLNKLEPYENTHPPLGKLFIAAGIALFGMNPFGWRIIGTLFGAAMIPVMYLFGRKMFEKRFYGFCAAFLMMFDFMHFTQTRIATIDVYATFFIIFMYYYMYDSFMYRSYTLGYRQSLKPLFFSGLFFGIGVACKWISIYAGAGLALLFFVAKYIEYKDYKKALGDRNLKNTQLVKDFIPLHITKTMAYCVVFFVIIPIIIYLLSYIPFMMIPGQGHGVANVWKLQLHMFNYHSGLNATHSFASPWYQWPIMYKPTWFYSGSDMPHGIVSTIVTMGNPAIWWVGIASFVASLLISIKKRDKKMAVVYVAFAFQYLPWVLVSRITWIYHFFSSVPFLILTIVYIIKYIIEKYKDSYSVAEEVQSLYIRYSVVAAYLGIVFILFVLFYPVLSGMPVSAEYVKGLRWFKSWIF